MSAVLNSSRTVEVLQPPDSTSNSWLLVQAYHQLRMRMETALRPAGLTGLQLTILIMLKNRSGMSSAELARRFYKTPQGMGQLLNALAMRDLIERAEHPENRRILQVSLTSLGRKIVASGEAAMKKVERDTFGHLDVDSIEMMRTALSQIGKRKTEETD